MSNKPERFARFAEARGSVRQIATLGQLDRRLLITLGLCPYTANIVMGEIEMLRAELALWKTLAGEKTGAPNAPDQRPGATKS